MIGIFLLVLLTNFFLTLFSSIVDNIFSFYLAQPLNDLSSIFPCQNPIHLLKSRSNSTIFLSFQSELIVSFSMFL